MTFARDFDAAVKNGQGDGWVVAFSWADAISVKRGPDEPYEDIGACLTLGAFKRAEIPRHFIQTSEGLNFAIQIPGDIWNNSTNRLIDFDEKLLFKLALR